MLSFDEFQAKFRGRHLLFLTEAWACRKESPSDLGPLMDRHALELKRLLREMWESMNEHQPSANGLVKK